jgi:hypothetical protein
MKKKIGSSKSLKKFPGGGATDSIPNTSSRYATDLGQRLNDKGYRDSFNVYGSAGKKLDSLVQKIIPFNSKPSSLKFKNGGSTTKKTKKK